MKAGVVQDKLFLPGLLKLQRLVRSGYFGRIIAARGEFGYWVYPGPEPAPQRPSWNYRREDGGGIISDMFAHWRYVLDNVFGPVRSVMAVGATHIPERIGEDGQPYEATAEDAAYAIFEFDDGLVVQMNSSWAVRVNRDELFELQVDGTEGSAVAGLRGCKIQPAVATPKSTWNPDLPDPIAHRESWIEVPATEPPENGFKLQWEAFLRHVVLDEPFPWDFVEGARGVQLTSWPSSRGRSDAGSTCRSSRCERRGAHPAARGRLSGDVHAGAARAAAGAGRRAALACLYAAAHVVADPLAGGDPTGPRSWTGRRRSRSGGTCGRTGCASPRRWTPRSAAWAWTGGDAGAHLPLGRRGEGRRRPAGVRRRHRSAVPGRLRWTRCARPTRSSSRSSRARARR